MPPRPDGNNENIFCLRRRNNELNEWTNFSWPQLGRQHCSSICSQSELQCFASNLHRMFAQRLLLLCRNRHANWLKIQKNLCAIFFAKQQVTKHAHMINEQSAKRSALKGQGRRRGFFRNPHLLNFSGFWTPYLSGALPVWLTFQPHKKWGSVLMIKTLPHFRPIVHKIVNHNLVNYFFFSLSL